MSAIPALIMGTSCIVGGATSFARTRSIPSVVAGVGIGTLYLYSGEHLRSPTTRGPEAALGASALLLATSLPRAARGPVPAMITLMATATGAYYAQTVYNMRRRERDEE
ncbi:hypothetical protein BC834DRAFT_670409 [Gloeopeniophorella convolvens]|nr:hypothetical protein BC834DRAFT_670409 [Gloeopeniophorella convolvens]